MQAPVSALKRRLAKIARKCACDRLTIAASGNISARLKGRFYVKAQGAFFEGIKSSEFVGMDICNPKVERGALRPSYEYRLHAACYKKRPEIKAVLHTHPLAAVSLYSIGIKPRPVTLEFAVYIGRRIIALPFLPPGSKSLAVKTGEAVVDNDAVILKRHGLVTVGRSLQEAYLRALVIEREARARLICRLFEKPPPFLRKDQLRSIL